MPKPLLKSAFGLLIACQLALILANFVETSTGWGEYAWGNLLVPLTVISTPVIAVIAGLIALCAYRKDEENPWILAPLGLIFSLLVFMLISLLGYFGAYFA